MNVLLSALQSVFAILMLTAIVGIVLMGVLQLILNLLRFKDYRASHEDLTKIGNLVRHWRYEVFADDPSAQVLLKELQRNFDYGWNGIPDDSEMRFDYKNAQQEKTSQQ